MRRVVITGMGVISPIGNNVDDMWNSVRSGVCGIDKISLFDTSNCDIKVAAEVKEFQPRTYLNPLEQKKMDRFSQMAVLASYEAYKDSKLESIKFNNNRFSVILGSVFGGSTIGPEYAKIFSDGYNSVSKKTIPFNLLNMPAANVAIELKAHNTCAAINTACASGTDCIGQAFRDIRHGYTDISIAGATEASINPIIIAGFAALGVMSKSNDIYRASIPFDSERSGFVMGEGAGALMLEEYEHAKARDAKIYGELVAYRSTCDAYSLTSPDLSLKQGIRAINEALDEASIGPTDIGYINAHGTSTKLNDYYETALIKNVFGDHCHQLAISSTKAMTGHMLGAAGAVEAIICAKALQDGFIPATINYKSIDPECDLDYVPNTGRKCQLEYVLSNSVGFGGHNSVLILKKL